MRNNVTAIEMQMGENHLENLESHQVNLAPFFFFFGAYLCDFNPQLPVFNVENQT